MKSFKQYLPLLLLGGTLTACDSSSNTETTSVEETGSSLDVTLALTPDETTSLRYAQFEFSAPDATGYECAINEESYSECESPFFKEEIALGSNWLSVRAYDESGSFGEVTSYNWYVNNVIYEGHEDLVATNVSPSPVEPNSWRGIFRINCDFAHSSYDDPIVYPGQNDAAHLHRFYGNTVVDEKIGRAHV